MKLSLNCIVHYSVSLFCETRFPALDKKVIAALEDKVLWEVQ
jgi:hypothetical protein